MVYAIEPSKPIGWAPLFPLPELVHLPGAHLPLHIFEPRYRVMVTDALAGEKLIAMAMIERGHEAEHMGAPPIEPWVGLGRILSHEALPDGRSNILLEGVARARVLEENRSRPYRLARIELQPDDLTGLTKEREAAIREALARAAHGVPPTFVQERMKLEMALKFELLDVGQLIDIVTDCMSFNADQKLRILRETRVVERGMAAIAMLREVGSGEHKLKFSRN
jgi:Lon protease-like protein